MSINGYKLIGKMIGILCYIVLFFVIYYNTIDSISGLLSFFILNLCLFSLVLVSKKVDTNNTDRKWIDKYLFIIYRNKYVDYLFVIVIIINGLLLVLQFDSIPFIMISFYGINTIFYLIILYLTHKKHYPN